MASEETTGGPGSEAAPTRAAEAVGAPRQIGPYTILRTLGRGGMSVVYLAHDPRNKREVALKVIPAGPDADPVDLARFRTEGEAVECLDHPNIVHLYDVGTAGDVAYLAMEYVDGGTLYRRIKDGRPIDPIDAAKIVEQIARAIHYAHRHGVIHRDLKPGNILLASPQSSVLSPQSSVLSHQSEKSRPRTEDSGRRTGDSGLRTEEPGLGIPKVADFGLAKQLDRSLRLTRTGTAVGTPHYMAPEQARGEPVIGPAIDIHGLGAVLYELLTGLPPYMGNSPAETMEQVVHKKPTPPSELRKNVPLAVEAICMKCLEKDPRKRYRTAEVVADQLRLFLNHPSDTTLFLPIEEPLPARRSLRSTIGLGLVLACILIAATSYITWRATRPAFQSLREQTHGARRAENRARLEAAIALCEQGQIRRGLQQMRDLDGDSGLPVHAIIAAWQGRVLENVAPIPKLTANVAAMSPHGDWLATADANHVRLTKAADWSQTETDWAVPQTVTALGWSEDRVHLAMATADGSVFVGNVVTGALNSKPVVTGKGQPIAAIAFTFAGVRIVYANATLRQEYLPPLRMKENQADPFGSTAGPFTLAAIASMTGDVAAVTTAGAIRLFDSTDLRWRDLPPDGDVVAIAYSPECNVLAVGTRGGRVRLWDAIARTPLTDSVQVGGIVQALAVGYSGQTYTIVAFPKDQAAVVLRCDRPWVGPPIRLRNRQGHEVLGVTFADGGTSLFITSSSDVSQWRIPDAKRYGPDRDYSASDRYGMPPGPSAHFSAPAAAMDNSVLVGGAGGKTLLLDRDGKSTQDTGTDQDVDEVTAVGVGRNGQISTACSHKKGGRTSVRHWARTMSDRPAYRELNTRVNQEAFLPDGSAVLLACADGYVRLWEPASDQFRMEINCGSPVLSVAASDDGNQLIAGCADGTAQIKNVATGETELILHNSSEVRAVAFADERAITASADGSCRRWHLPTGLPLGPPLKHPDAISSLSIWKQLLATGGRGRYVRSVAAGVRRPICTALPRRQLTISPITHQSLAGFDNSP